LDDVTPEKSSVAGSALHNRRRTYVTGFQAAPSPV